MADTDYALVIGDKNYSSWSLRPWLAMRRFGITFSEINVDLYNPGMRERILEHSPSARVPALKTQGKVIWDTMAILECLAEWHPDHPWWPSDRLARALARSVSAEMHSGFADLRTDMPMNILNDKSGGAVSEATGRDITRVIEIWRMCRSEFGASGSFLFGDFSIADAMYAPVATRLNTYGVDLPAYGDDGTAAAYIKTIFAMTEMEQWIGDARDELKERGIAQ